MYLLAKITTIMRTTKEICRKNNKNQKELLGEIDTLTECLTL